MLKYVVGIVIVFGFALYVSTEYKQHSQDGASQSPAPSAPPVTPTTNEQSESDISNAKWHAPSWYRLFAWPDGVTTWGILLTLLAIAEQTSETSKAARASLAQTNLQTAAMSQWVDVGVEKLTDLGDGKNEVGELMPSHKFELLLKAGNSTPYPFTIERFTAHVFTDGRYGEKPSWEVFCDIKKSHTIPPDQSQRNFHTFSLLLELPDEVFSAYQKGNLTLPIVGDVAFQPAVGEFRVQNYDLLTRCRPFYVTEIPGSTRLVSRKILENKIANERHDPN